MSNRPVYYHHYCCLPAKNSYTLRNILNMAEERALHDPNANFCRASQPTTLNNVALAETPQTTTKHLFVVIYAYLNYILIKCLGPQMEAL